MLSSKHYTMFENRRHDLKNFVYNFRVHEFATPHRSKTADAVEFRMLRSEIPVYVA